MVEPSQRDREVRGRVEHHIHRGELNAANGVIADYRDEIEQRMIVGLSPVAGRASAVEGVSAERGAAMREPRTRTIMVELDEEELEMLEGLCRGETVGGRVAEADRLGDKLASAAKRLRPEP